MKLKQIHPHELVVGTEYFDCPCDTKIRMIYEGKQNNKFVFVPVDEATDYYKHIFDKGRLHFPSLGLPYDLFYKEIKN